jgi:hypothetical protein
MEKGLYVGYQLASEELPPDAVMVLGDATSPLVCETFIRRPEVKTLCIAIADLLKVRLDDVRRYTSPAGPSLN